MEQKEGLKKEKEKEKEFKDLEKQFTECQRLKDQYLAGWQRARAELLNYKKEEMERVGNLIKYALEGLILKILPILDNFEIAEKKLPPELKKDKNIEGFLQIKTQLQDFLKSQEVEEIKCVGERFNPQFHEVIEEVKLENKEPGIVLEEVQKGYKLHERVLRPAKVKISK